MTVEVWIASHMDSDKRFEHLKQTIQSLLKAGIVKIIISISYSIENFDIVQNYIEVNNIHFYKHDGKLSQFEHYNFIYQSEKKSSRRIMFIDDDDILINIPEEFKTDKVVVGYQYICYPDFNFDNPVDLNEIEKEVDFSGYSCFIEDFYEYFNEIHHTLFKSQRSIEDIYFMKYLNKKDHLKPDSPFIFHRVTNFSNTWGTDLSKSIKDLSSASERLILINKRKNEIVELIKRYLKFASDIKSCNSKNIPKEIIEEGKYLKNIGSVELLLEESDILKKETTEIYKKLF